MGKGHDVAVAYMGISEGEPQPMTDMNVGGSRERRESGVTEAESVRRYS